VPEREQSFPRRQKRKRKFQGNCSTRRGRGGESRPPLKEFFPIVKVKSLRPAPVQGEKIAGGEEGKEKKTLT